ncbi:MAG: Gfo/Idh/MocA family oxidoreductase [Proteobacteria bacterium]|nr:Gfo/Idh/MocA family oxidoreductase [Pseudomonadota bacterium]
MAGTIAAELRGLGGAGAELHAVGSRSRAAAAAFAQRFGIGRTHGSYADLARDDEVDVVYIATPPALHAENALACIARGKGVLCEKPFALNAHEASEMVRAARTQRVFLMEAMWTRFLPAIAAVRSLVADGTLGRLRLVVGGGGFVPVFDAKSPLFDPRLGGGVLLDAGVYLVSLASMLLGAPSGVLAQGELGPSGVDEQETILLRGADGAQAALYVSLQARRPPDLEILGSAGRLHVAAPVFRPTRLTLTLSEAAPVVSEHPVAGSGYAAQLVEVTRALQQGRLESPVMPLNETLSILRTMDLVRACLGLRYPQD